MHSGSRTSRMIIGTGFCDVGVLLFLRVDLSEAPNMSLQSVDVSICFVCLHVLSDVNV